MEFRKIKWGDAALVYDEEKDLFRFVDGKFAFSCEHADRALLRKRGRINGHLALHCTDAGARLQPCPSRNPNETTR